MDTVLWWEEDDAGRPLRLLVVGPGSPPRAEEPWVHYSFDGHPAPGGWAHLNITSLEDLSHTAHAAVASAPAPGAGMLRQLVIAPDDQLRGRFEHVDMAGSGFTRCQQEATALLAQRLAQPMVASEPGHAGVWLSRLRMAEGHMALDVAPAETPDDEHAGVPVRVFGFDRPRVGMKADSDSITWCEGDLEAAARTRHHVLPVQLDSVPPADLPAITWEWPVTIDDGPSACRWQQTGLHVTRSPGHAWHLVVEARVPLHGCRWAPVCEPWQDPVAGVPVGIMTMTAPLPR